MATSSVSFGRLPAAFPSVSVLLCGGRAASRAAVPASVRNQVGAHDQPSNRVALPAQEPSSAGGDYSFSSSSSIGRPLYGPAPKNKAASTRLERPNLLRPSIVTLQAITNLRSFSTETPDKPGGTIIPDAVPASGEPAAGSCNNPELKQKILDLIKGSKAVLFMKGNPEEPLCGFSAQVIKLFDLEEFEDYIFVDVLKSEDVREIIKEVSDWPTIPQLFVNGEFVGGAQILLEMHAAGELKELLQKVSEN
ncbi:unnamed protein product [Amoebophrya sp. A120]|nr:unnamed protein product [Amoebophrya sp. A120]|eukprot:GSA120T00024130001.1